VNLGIAVAASVALLVPNVKGADVLPFAGLAQAIDGLAATARAGKTTPADLAGGRSRSRTLACSASTRDADPDARGGGDPGLGQVRDLPWVVSGELAVRRSPRLSLSFDHRMSTENWARRCCGT